LVIKEVEPLWQVDFSSSEKVGEDLSEEYIRRQILRRKGVRLFNKNNPAVIHNASFINATEEDPEMVIHNISMLGIGSYNNTTHETASRVITKDYNIYRYLEINEAFKPHYSIIFAGNFIEVFSGVARELKEVVHNTGFALSIKKVQLLNNLFYDNPATVALDIETNMTGLPQENVDYEKKLQDFCEQVANKEHIDLSKIEN
jgi:hypothetical protein